MVALAHLEKFFADHPKCFPEGGKHQLEKAREAAVRGIIGSGDAEKILGAYSSVLFHLMSTDIEYIRISFESAKAVCADDSE